MRWFLGLWSIALCLCCPSQFAKRFHPRKEKVAVWWHSLPIALLNEVESGTLSLCLCHSKEHVAQVDVKDCSSADLLMGATNLAVTWVCATPTCG